MRSDPSLSKKIKEMCFVFYFNLLNSPKRENKGEALWWFSGRKRNPALSSYTTFPKFKEDLEKE